MIRLLLILFLFLLQSSSVFAQIVTVLDAETRKPLESVSVFQHQRSSFGSTNVNGKVQIQGFIKNIPISFRLLGYQARSISIDDLEASNYRIFLTPDNLSMAELIVAANRWNQETDEVPVYSTKINPALINLENPQTSADLLGLSGQVFIQKSQQGGGSPMIRGFATNRLIYSVDGVRMNTAIFRGGNIQNVISLDPFAMESTEIVLGPNSVMFGSDAIGGTMAFETLKPLF
jgi:hemoglobin/transferrin/lactoferrin receptor protein